ncbi:unnamed protein product [Prorocentrum cordatum]|uniref:CR-type domain-containing protein n=1 Tax=Prorocentrum cordatum TaxID=2364126 RepID=A0ABN9TMT3_9DINO|nr:unnamed protein product [Polarella glacialis]
MPRSECPDCFGEGKVTEETAKKCHNCNGVGSKAAGRGSRFVCNVCEGEGELVQGSDGTAPRAAARAGPAPRRSRAWASGGSSAGGARRSSRRTTPGGAAAARGATRTEAGGSAPRRPAAGARGGEEASVPRPAREKSAAGAAADAAAEVAQRGALAAFGVSGRGFHWHEGRGLEVDLFFTPGAS